MGSQMESAKAAALAEPEMATQEALAELAEMNRLVMEYLATPAAAGGPGGLLDVRSQLAEYAASQDSPAVQGPAGPQGPDGVCGPEIDTIEVSSFDSAEPVRCEPCGVFDDHPVPKWPKVKCSVCYSFHDKSKMTANGSGSLCPTCAEELEKKRARARARTRQRHAMKIQDGDVVTTTFSSGGVTHVPSSSAVVQAVEKKRAANTPPSWDPLGALPKWYWDLPEPPAPAPHPIRWVQRVSLVVVFLATVFLLVESVLVGFHPMPLLGSLFGAGVTGWMVRDGIRLVNRHRQPIIERADADWERGRSEVLRGSSS